MGIKTLWKANIKQHKGAMFGIFLILLLASSSLFSMMTIWKNTSTYLNEEFHRMHYGTLTAWISNLNDTSNLEQEIEHIDDVASVKSQDIIYSDYEINGIESDSEGQLILHDEKEYPYKFYHDSLHQYTESLNINEGEIYVSPSLLSTYDFQIGDEIEFKIGRQGNQRIFKIAGFFEDPFMGSSMIGMKSFLISNMDYQSIMNSIQNLGIDALARQGNMLHITQKQSSTLSNAAFSKKINEQTQLQEHVEFVHSDDALKGFMSVLQTIFAGLFLVFSFILIVISLIVVGYSITGILEQDEKNLGILKAIGYSSKQLRLTMKLQYLVIVFLGCIIGMSCSIPFTLWIRNSMVSFSGILIPTNPDRILWIFVLCLLLILFYGFVTYKTRQIKNIVPYEMIRGVDITKETLIKHRYHTIKKKHLIFNISLRQLQSGKKKYRSVIMISILLVFFASSIGRMNDWLGVNGKGMMDAFNPADLDLGVQVVGRHDKNEIKSSIEKYSLIIDEYALAMPSVNVNGVDYTANVISDPQRFHIQQGKTISSANEIVITETVAKDLDLEISDHVSINVSGVSKDYIVSGIYQCANDMGGNIGMSKEGYLNIGTENPNMWCYHYFFENQEIKETIINALQDEYGGDVYIHENSWPGLYSIIFAMKVLLIVMYVIMAVFILIVTNMTAHKVFQSEKKVLSIYKMLGLTSSQLRMTFAVRFMITSFLGAILGVAMSCLLSDVMISALMKLYGISNFASSPTIMNILFPLLVVSLLFGVFAYGISRKVKKVDSNDLIAEI